MSPHGGYVIRFLCLAMGLIFSMGCAGPMSPFGALPLFQTKSVEDQKAGLSKSRARVRFTPDRQVLHGSTSFSVIIEDPQGVPEDFKLVVSYNGKDVTKSFLSHAKQTSLDPLNHEIKLTTKHLRLLPAQDNRVQVSYWRTTQEQSAVSQYMPPSCSAFASNQMVFSIPDFDPPLVTLQLINQNAQRKNLNPYFVAALVAQESSFDPRALSRGKALGLTQVTSMGESEIIKSFETWPRYPGLASIPLPLLKIAIMSGRIHSGNEWRLDPAHSIEGGVEYLSYLSEFWNRPEKHAQIVRALGPAESALSEVVLASYNSGASRVGEALERNGSRWLQDDELGEARKYVRRIVSYCDHFEHGED